MQLGLRQKDVAPQLGVGEHTLADWERDQSAPSVSYYPAVIAFLGFEPWDKPKTFGEKLRAERYKRGWTIAQMVAWRSDSMQPGWGDQFVRGLLDA